MKGLKEDLRETAVQVGADLFGVASVEDLNDAPSGHRPTDILRGAKSVIVLGMKMLDAQTDVLPIEGDSSEVAPRQDMFKGHNTFISQQLDRVGYDLSRFLEKKGFKAFHQMASTGGTDQRYLVGLLSLKHLAVKAGVGVFGRHSLLITPQYGPRVRLTAIITDAKLQPDKPFVRDFCKECESPCISLCPARALKKPIGNSPYEINKFACSQYLNTRPACSVCLKVCPVGTQRVR
jgi:epoxyqueuosine reductase QueG